MGRRLLSRDHLRDLAVVLGDMERGRACTWGGDMEALVPGYPRDSETCNINSILNSHMLPFPRVFVELRRDWA